MDSVQLPIGIILRQMNYSTGVIIAPDGTKFPLLDLTKFKDLQETEKDEVRGDWAEQSYKRNELKGFLLTNAVSAQ